MKIEDTIHRSSFDVWPKTARARFIRFTLTEQLTLALPGTFPVFCGITYITIAFAIRNERLYRRYVLYQPAVL
jgi:hypothetical protein